MSGTGTSQGPLGRAIGTLRLSLTKTQSWKIYSLNVRSFMTNTCRETSYKGSSAKATSMKNK